MPALSNRLFHKKPFPSLRFKSIFLFSLVCFVIFGVGFYWVYSYSKQLILDEIYHKLSLTASFLASQTDGDAHQRLYAQPDYDPELEWPPGMKVVRYWQISNILYDIHLVLPQAYTYTYLASDFGGVDIVVSMGAVIELVEGSPPVSTLSLMALVASG